MQTFALLIFAAAGLATTLGAQAPSAAADTFGVWELNVSKSRLPDPVLAAVKIEEPAGPNALRDTIDYKMGDGSSRLSINPYVRMDGTEHPLEQVTVLTGRGGKQEIVRFYGATGGFTFLRERAAGRWTRSVIRKDGRQVASIERTLSEDGATLTVIRKYTDGRPTAVLVWERRRSGAPR